MESARGTLRTLPYFQGEYEAKSKTKKIPSQQHQSPKILDVGNLTKLLATPIRCTLLLAELLKAKLELWKEVRKCMKHIRIDLSLMERAISFSTTTHNPKSEPIPLNKVGQCNDGEDANTTLPIELNGCKHIAILDSGVWQPKE